MKVHALRGVCIGVEQHLAAGADADLEAAQANYLASIGAVEIVPATPLDADTAVVSETPTPAKPGKKEK